MYDRPNFDNEAQRDFDAAVTCALDLRGKIACVGPSRAASLSLTKLDECILWLGKAIEESQVKREQGPRKLEDLIVSRVPLSPYDTRESRK